MRVVRLMFEKEEKTTAEPERFVKLVKITFDRWQQQEGDEMRITLETLFVEECVCVECSFGAEEDKERCCADICFIS